MYEEASYPTCWLITNIIDLSNAISSLVVNSGRLICLESVYFELLLNVLVSTYKHVLHSASQTHELSNSVVQPALSPPRTTRRDGDAT